MKEFLKTNRSTRLRVVMAQSYSWMIQGLGANDPFEETLLVTTEDPNPQKKASATVWNFHFCVYYAVKQPCAASVWWSFCRRWRASSRGWWRVSRSWWACRRRDRGSCGTCSKWPVWGYVKEMHSTAPLSLQQTWWIASHFTSWHVIIIRSQWVSKVCNTYSSVTSCLVQSKVRSPVSGSPDVPPLMTPRHSLPQLWVHLNTHTHWALKGSFPFRVEDSSLHIGWLLRSTLWAGFFFLMITDICISHIRR